MEGMHCMNGACQARIPVIPGKQIRSFMTLALAGQSLQFPTSVRGSVVALAERERRVKSCHGTIAQWRMMVLLSFLILQPRPSYVVLLWYQA